MAKAARANPSRGEHELTLAGISYVLRPSFAACSEIENTLDMSLIEVFRVANTMSLTYEQIGVILAALIRAGAQDDLTRNVNAERLAELVFEDGVGKAVAVLIFVLADAISGGRDVSGEAKAQANPTT